MVVTGVLASRRGRIACAAAGAAVLLIVVLVWWRPFGPTRPAVPSCAELVAALPEAVPGAWEIDRGEREPRVSNSSALCELRLAPAEGRFTVTVSVLLIGNSDRDYQAREMAMAECRGQLETAPYRSGYDTSKQCVLVLGDVVRAGVYATRGERYTHVVARVVSASGTQDEVVTFARNTAHRVAGHILTVPAED